MRPGADAGLFFGPQVNKIAGGLSFALCPQFHSAAKLIACDSGLTEKKTSEKEIFKKGGASNMAATVRCQVCDNGTAAEFKIEGDLKHGMPESYWRHLHTAHPLACEWVRGLLPTYIHGRPSVETRERIARHIGSCESCRDEHQQRV